MDQPDRMKSASNANLEVFKRFIDIAEAHSRFGAELEQNLTAPLESCYDACMEARKSAVAQEKDASDLMGRAQSTMNRSRLKAMRILNGSDDGAHLKNSMLDMTRKLRGKHKRTALEACTRYNEDLNHANFIQKTYLSYDMPACLSELQAMEELRIEATKRNLSKFTENHRSLLSTLSEKDVEIDEVIARVDAKNDLSQYTQNTLHLHGAPEPVRPFVYNLPRSLEELHLDQQAQATAQVDGGSLFGGELSDIMKMSANQGCTVPKIITSLCEALQSTGGFQKEGVFRLAASTTEQAALKNQVASHNYKIEPSVNPHAIASTIKLFLRELDKPLFPSNLYQTCLRLGLKAKEDPDLDSKEQRFDEMYSQVPSVNRATIEYVIRFIAEVAKHEKVNRMGVRNLAIIFAPSMLRDPSGDPMSMMRNTQYESGFLIYLIEVLSKRLPAWSSDGGGGGGGLTSPTATNHPVSNGAVSNGHARSSISLTNSSVVGGGLPSPTIGGGLPKPGGGAHRGAPGAPMRPVPTSLPARVNTSLTTFPLRPTTVSTGPPTPSSNNSSNSPRWPPAATSSSHHHGVPSKQQALHSSGGSGLGAATGTLGGGLPPPVAVPTRRPLRPSVRGPPPKPPGSGPSGGGRPSSSPTSSIGMVMPSPTAAHHQPTPQKQASPRGVGGLPPVPTRKRRQSRGRGPPPPPPGSPPGKHSSFSRGPVPIPGS